MSEGLSRKGCVLHSACARPDRCASGAGFADASLVSAAERRGVQTIFTIGRNDFAAYRMKRGHRHYAFKVIG